MQETPVYRSEEQKRILGILPDLIRARELLFDLVWKDLRVRYRYAAMGFVWAIIEPLAMVLVLTFVFTKIFAVRAGADALNSGYDYPVSLLCGLIFWQYLAAATIGATNSLIDNQNLVTKVRFTREVIPLSAVLNPLLNLLIGALLLFAVFLLRGGALSLAHLLLAPLFLIEFALVLGLALLLSTGNVYYRDVGYITGVTLMFAFYASPVIYDLHLVQNAGMPGWTYRLYMLNPMAALLTSYREVLFDHRMPRLALLIGPALFATASLLLGAAVFRRSAPTLSDHL